MVEAFTLIGRVFESQTKMWESLTRTWEKSRFPKGHTVEGKEFVWVLDDVKDHYADRRVGLDYMLAPVQRMEIPTWRNKLLERIKNYAKSKGVPIKGIPVERLED